jgi:pyrroline-5-carboxylate reductase
MAEARGDRVGLIGAGALGGAMIDRLLASGGFRPCDIVACEPKDARRDEIHARFGVTATADPGEAADCGIVVLAAPPLEIPKILQAIAGRLQHRPLVISCAAAIPLNLLEGALPSDVPVLRMNPNSPSVVSAGFNPVVLSARMTLKDRERADRFLALFGARPPVADKEMNLYTALTAVGPTYFLPVFDAMIRAGVDGGLTKEAATAAAAETARGCAEMVMKRQEAPEQLKLLTGLRPLDDAAARALVMKAISDAFSRMESVERQATSQANS